MFFGSPIESRVRNLINGRRRRVGDTVGVYVADGSDVGILEGKEEGQEVGLVVSFVVGTD